MAETAGAVRVLIDRVDETDRLLAEHAPLGALLLDEIVQAAPGAPPRPLPPAI